MGSNRWRTSGNGGDGDMRAAAGMLCRRLRPLVDSPSALRPRVLPAPWQLNYPICAPVVPAGSPWWDAFQAVAAKLSAHWLPLSAIATASPSRWPTGQVNPPHRPVSLLLPRLARPCGQPRVLPRGDVPCGHGRPPHAPPCRHSLLRVLAHERDRAPPAQARRVPRRECLPARHRHLRGADLRAGRARARRRRGADGRGGAGRGAGGRELVQEPAIKYSVLQFV